MNAIQFNSNLAKASETENTVFKWGEYALPASLEMGLLPIARAASDQSPRTRRELEFAAGRSCAHSVLSVWGERREVRVAEDRSPIWPNGFVGSISHSDRWAWSAVSRQRDLRSIGIDTEMVVDQNAVDQLKDEIATPSEWALAQNKLSHLCFRQVFTIVFSAKEAFYKCWSPLTGEFFGFLDAVITDVDAEKLVLKMQPSNPNAILLPKSLPVFYLVTLGNVFTSTWMNHEDCQ